MAPLAFLLALAAGDPVFETSRLEAGTRVDKMLARDLTGDGYPDLLVQSGRDLYVFRFEKGRGFAPSPAPLRFDGTVFLWTLGALDGHPAPVLLTAGSRGVQGHPFEGGAFRARGIDLVVHPSALEGNASEGTAPAYVDFAPDLDRDGRSDVVLFGTEETLVMRQFAETDFRCLQKLPLAIDVTTALNWAANQKVREVTTIPSLSFADADGDGRADLTYYREESIGVFRQRADGRFAPLETHDLVQDKQKRRSRRFFQYDLPPRMGDFNKDGVLDVAVIYPSKGRVHVHYGRAGRAAPSEPHVLKIADGWTTGIYLEDLDADGKSDLIMGVVRKLGISDGIKVFVSGKVNLELMIFPMEAAGRFADSPVRQLIFEIPFTFEMTRESGTLDVTFRPSFRGDFNKDGLRDLLVAADARTLSIYPGVAGRGIDDRPAGKIVMNPPEGVATTEPFVEDFNRDGVSDLVLKHLLIEQGKHVLEVKLSRE